MLHTFCSKQTICNVNGKYKTFNYNFPRTTKLVHYISTVMHLESAENMCNTAAHVFDYQQLYIRSPF